MLMLFIRYLVVLTKLHRTPNYTCIQVDTWHHGGKDHASSHPQPTRANRDFPYLPKRLAWATSSSKKNRGLVSKSVNAWPTKASTGSSQPPESADLFGDTGMAEGSPSRQAYLEMEHPFLGLALRPFDPKPAPNEEGHRCFVSRVVHSSSEALRGKRGKGLPSKETLTPNCDFIYRKLFEAVILSCMLLYIRTSLRPRIPSRAGLPFTRETSIWTPRCWLAQQSPFRRRDFRESQDSWFNVRSGVEIGR